MDPWYKLRCRTSHWQALYQRTVTPPFKPKVAGAGDVSNFEPLGTDVVNDGVLELPHVWTKLAFDVVQLWFGYVWTPLLGNC